MGHPPFHGIFSSFGSRGWNQSTSVDPGEQAAITPERESPPSARSSSVGQIAVDIYEQEGYIIIRAPLAGVRLSDLDIEVDDKVLTIRGRRTVPDQIPADQHYLQECFWGEFERRVTLPCVIDPKRVKATFNRDCILKVLVPKEERIKVVRISEGI